MEPRPRLSTLLTPAFANPLMSHQYVISSTGSMGPKGNKVSVENLFTPLKYFSTHVESIDLPFKTFNVEERHIMATKKWYAGYSSFNSFNATFFENDNADSLKGFIRWQNRIVDRGVDQVNEGNYFPASNYQTTMDISLLKNDDSVSATALLSGVWPTQVTQITLTGAEITRVVLQVTFSVNKVKWLFH